MFKKLRSPYRYRPVYTSTSQIDRLIEMGATAEMQDPGRKGMKNQIIVTFRDRRGEVVDQFAARGNGHQLAKFVVAFNRRSAAARIAAPRPRGY